MSERQKGPPGPPPPGLLEALGEAVLATDPSGRITYFNPAARRLLGPALPAATEHLLGPLLGLDGDAAWREALEGPRRPVRLDAAGGPVDALLSLRPLRAADGTVTGAAAVVLDLPADHVPDAEGSSAERRFHSLLDTMSELVSVHGPDMEARYVAGRGAGEAADVPDLRRRVHPEDLPRVDQAFGRWLAGEDVVVLYRARSRNGQWRSYESAGVNLLDDPAVRGVVVTTRDVDDRVRMQEELVRRAFHDHLTQLPSRALFLDRLEQALARAERSGGHVAVLRLDVDSFRGINETYGHATGDEVLRGVAGLVRDVVPPGDTVARLAGDEFAVCCERIGDPADAEALAHAIVAALVPPLVARGRSIPVTVSAGIAALAPGAGVDAETALHQAEIALDHAKEGGRQSIAVFDEAIGTEQLRRARLRRDLLAVEVDQLAVHYQPQVRLSTGELTGFEALLRWQHPTLGAVRPDEFIPLAEETGLILPLGRFVLETACRELALLRGASPAQGLTMAVNLSTRQLVDDTLADFLGELLQATGIDPAALCLEITESAVMQRGVESEQRLRRLKQCGVQLSIDDFGTGYSSLAYLKRFPLDQVKIDREFVWGLGTNPEDAVIIASVARLGESLQLEVVAEGVETSAHRDELASLGCHLGQGYLWSRPRPGAELEQLLHSATSWDAARPGERPPPALERSDAPDIDEVVAVLRHELANPVTVIQGYTELLQQSEGGGLALPVTDALDAISRSTAGLQSLILALTDLRHIGAGTVDLDRRALDLGDEVRSVLSEMAADLAGRPVTFARGAGGAVADPRRVRQIVRTLLDNALKHTPPGTAIEVEVRAAGLQAEVRITDRGPGVPPEHAGQLFAKFARLGARGEGTGLGLFVARGLARAHGGDLRHETPPGGRGAAFVLALPGMASQPEAPG